MYIFFFTYRTEIYRKYPGIFIQDDGDEELRGEDNRTEAEKKQDEAEERKAEKWNYFKLVYALTKGDITKRDQVLKMNYISVLNWLAFELENKSIKEYYDKRSS